MNPVVPTEVAESMTSLLDQLDDAELSLFVQLAQKEMEIRQLSQVAVHWFTPAELEAL